MRAVSLFTGACGADLGMTEAGIETVLGIEHDAYAVATCHAAGLDYVKHGDVRDLSLVEDLEDIDLVYGGPPCQAFSTAGKREAQDSDRNGWPWALDVVDLVKPQWVLFENVPGLLHHSKDCADPCAGCYWTGDLLPAFRERFPWVGHRTLNASQYGTVVPCPLHDTACLTDAVKSAASASRCATAQAFAGLPAMASVPVEARRSAAHALGHLALAIRAACASGATCDERVRSLLALARSGPTTLPGREAATLTTAAMSEFGWPASTAESIVLWLSASLDALSRSGKLCTTSTATRRTITLTILRCIAATAITSPATGTASRMDGCGLCVDWAVPQHRRRVFLVGGPGPILWPQATHGDPATFKALDLFGRRLKPWTTVRDALNLDAWVYTAGTKGNAEIRIIGGGRNPQSAEDADKRSYRDLTDEPCTTIAAAAAGNAGPWLVGSGLKGSTWEVEKPAPTLRDGNGTAGLYLERPSPTVTAQEVKGTRASAASGWTFSGGPDRASDAVWAATGRRRLTVAECARLQDFPAGHPFQGTKTAQYRQIGNAWPRTFGRVLGQALLEADRKLRVCPCGLDLIYGHCFACDDPRDPTATGGCQAQSATEMRSGHPHGSNCLGLVGGPSILPAPLHAAVVQAVSRTVDEALAAGRARGCVLR